MKRDPLEVLRELAKGDYYQSLYSCAKELGLQLFENTTDLTRIQLWLLSFSSMYAVITTDIALGECPETVLKNFIYEDAYMHFRSKKSKNELLSKNKNIILPSKKKEEFIPKSSWSFKRNKK